MKTLRYRDIGEEGAEILKSDICHGKDTRLQGFRFWARSSDGVVASFCYRSIFIGRENQMPSFCNWSQAWKAFTEEVQEHDHGAGGGWGFGARILLLFFFVICLSRELCFAS